MDHPTTHEPTLDDQRTDQLRTFLTVEAAAGAAAAPTRHPGRRILAGGAIALFLGGVLFAATSVGGGPSSPVATRAEAAVSITPAGDGWIDVRLADIDADPDQVVRELRAAGIDASKEPIASVSLSPSGEPMLSSHGPDGSATIDAKPSALQVFGLVDGKGGPGGHGLAGISVKVPEGIALPPDGPEAPIDPSSPFNQAMERHGVRLAEDGLVSVRRGAAVTIVVLVAA